MSDEELPRDVVVTRTTDVFDDATVPPGLLGRHTLRAGSWGVLHVQKGVVVFRFLEPVVEERTLAAGDALVIAPVRAHQIVETRGARFQLTFHRVPGT